ncbi:hypothetical protein GALMADRAFT_245516 [Galerina marginata CBS 339.88]|uniref:Uncharacterized protein n=1 Tax=Galerina marginata (strain CBS 339.88) TaxID=685588 RepID=A0A067T5G6_GALM3|nr:hypothetical protein GALMADRAFT_245516 [Galerina marginata CBS 339.88]
MRPSKFLIAASLALVAQASWFGSSSSEPAYSNWDAKELRAWLEVHNIPLPKHPQTQAELKGLVEQNWDSASAWTYDQYAAAQKSFSDLRETAFDSWDESRLREFLLEHGVVAPKGPKEHLILLAKQKYNAYNKAASSFASRASATASTAVYGDTQHQMSKSVSSVASQATSAAAQASKDAMTAFDESKDYIYSTWDDNQMRTWLEERGAIKTKSQLRRAELLKKMDQLWGKVSDPVWEAWSDSYIHGWLVSHNIIKSETQKNRDALVKMMKDYYYVPTDAVYNSWADSQLKEWLVEHGIMKSNAQASRDKMLKMVQDNYLSAKDTFWSAWSDNSIRDWLIENGYMRSDAQLKRDKLIKLANDKWNDRVAATNDYLTWPDARLRAYLREHGVSDSHLPGSRPGLLQETRIRWVQTQTRSERLWGKVKNLFVSAFTRVQNTFRNIFSIVTGRVEDAKERADATKRAGEKGWADTKKMAEDGYDKAGEWVDGKREKVGEKVKVEGQKIKGEL